MADRVAVEHGVGAAIVTNNVLRPERGFAYTDPCQDQVHIRAKHTAAVPSSVSRGILAMPSAEDDKISTKHLRKGTASPRGYGSVATLGDSKNEV